MKSGFRQYSSGLRSLSVILLMAFLLAQFGPYLNFKAQQYWVKKEIKKRIKNGVPESELTNFTFEELATAKKFSWVKEGKEFMLGETMYDIVRTDGNIVKCINDSQEKELFTDLEKMVSQTSHEKASNTQGTFALGLYDVAQVADFYFLPASSEIVFQPYQSQTANGFSLAPIIPPAV